MTSLPPQMNRPDAALMAPLPEKVQLVPTPDGPTAEQMFEMATHYNPDGTVTPVRKPLVRHPKPPLGKVRDQSKIMLRTHDSTKATAWRVTDSAHDTQPGLNKDYEVPFSSAHVSPNDMMIGVDPGDSVKGDVTVVATRSLDGTVNAATVKNVVTESRAEIVAKILAEKQKLRPGKKPSGLDIPEDGPTIKECSEAAMAALKRGVSLDYVRQALQSHGAIKVPDLRPSMRRSFIEDVNKVNAAQPKPKAEPFTGYYF